MEIIGEILDSLMEGPLKKTHITFRCNLDSRAVSKYLLEMIHIGLVDKSKDNPILYSITQKGIDFRNQFHTVISIVEKGFPLEQKKDFANKEITVNLTTKK